MSNSDKIAVKTSTPLRDNTVVLSLIEGAHDPDSAHLTEMTIEQRVRLAWERFKDHEDALAHQRKIDARLNNKKGQGGGLPPTSKRGKSSQFTAVKVGLRATSFRVAQSVVQTADFLRSQGRSQEADKLLDLLNNVSVNAAKRERSRLQHDLVDYLMARIRDEEEIQQSVNESL